MGKCGKCGERGEGVIALFDAEAKMAYVPFYLRNKPFLLLSFNLERSTRASQHKA